MPGKPIITQGKDDREPDTTRPSPSFEVGYGKPPAAHRFQKGRSGNPRGRPKAARKEVPRGQGLDFGSQPANQMLLEEAYRTISVREGDQIVELPVIKAVFRSLGVSAMKGNRLAQATMAELVRGIEEEDRRVRASLFETACEYKIGWQEAFEQARRHGLPEPDVVPHPDDVILDMRRAEVRYEGPMTPEEKRRWDRMLKFRDQLQGEVSKLAASYRDCAAMKQPPLDHMRSTAGFWEQYTAMYDRLNDPLPERYKRRLVDRFSPGLAKGSNGSDTK